jgi:hypothetical protein
MHSISCSVKKRVNSLIFFHIELDLERTPYSSYRLGLTISCFTE